MNIAGKQRGSTLLVALIMLVLMTLIAISAMNATTNSVQVVGNAQFREEANAAGQQAIERVISTSDFKATAPAAQTVDVNGDGTVDYNVTFTPAPSCISYTNIDDPEAGTMLFVGNILSPNGQAKCLGNLCFWVVWEVTAVVTDAHGSGATATIHQGVKTITGLTDKETYCGV